MALRMRWYVPQRQMLPLMKSSISESVGLGFLASSATADMICPDWQYPHCGTSSAIHACWTGWLPSADKPSMVVTFFPATLEMAVWQERAASPLMCTVQAPHKPAPQPNFVPVLSSVSRSTQSKGISGLTFTVSDFPLRMKVMAIEPPSGRAYPTTTDGRVKTSTTIVRPVANPQRESAAGECAFLSPQRLRWPPPEQSAARPVRRNLPALPNQRRHVLR